MPLDHNRANRSGWVAASLQGGGGTGYILASVDF